ncbi:hypothetical protein AYI69_g3941 [Smittium culicis]|uniref:CCHC-type domain-containing protein n=1 Tax=Smittium culicis TaxID=133412 RepID=A0A1R1YIC8_9FUNG|nr:hypothetical protein AYI69_g3941 [Smittium culicis]
MEEDIMTVNIPNFKDISITKMIELVTKQLKPLSEIKDISDLCNKYRNEYIPYGMKVLLRKNAIETELPLFLDHEDGRINIFYRGCKGACGYCKKDGHWKLECPKLKNITSKNKFMSDMAKSPLKFSLPEPTKVDILIPSASITKYDAQKPNNNNTWNHDTPKISGDYKYLTKNESSATNSTTVNRRMGSVGLKKPPAYSICRGGN